MLQAAALTKAIDHLPDALRTARYVVRDENVGKYDILHRVFIHIHGFDVRRRRRRIC